nr:hypothetical protein [Tanacetum cinerariifolium]
AVEGRVAVQLILPIGVVFGRDELLASKVIDVGGDADRAGVAHPRDARGVVVRKHGVGPGLTAVLYQVAVGVVAPVYQQLRKAAGIEQLHFMSQLVDAKLLSIEVSAKVYALLLGRHDDTLLLLVVAADEVAQARIAAREGQVVAVEGRVAVQLILPIGVVFGRD